MVLPLEPPTLTFRRRRLYWPLLLSVLCPRATASNMPPGLESFPSSIIDDTTRKPRFLFSFLFFPHHLFSSSQQASLVAISCFHMTTLVGSHGGAPSPNRDFDGNERGFAGRVRRRGGGGGLGRKECVFNGFSGAGEEAEENRGGRFCTLGGLSCDGLGTQRPRWSSPVRRAGEERELCWLYVLMMLP